MRTPSNTAPGGVQLSSSSVILTTSADAGQGVKNEREPSGAPSIPSGGIGVNRRSVMNMFVSSVAVAATAAPALALTSTADEPRAPNHKAILARVEQIVDFLRTRYVREGWKIDEDQAARALDYFRRCVHGPAFKDEDEDTAAYHQGPLEFFRSHGQSLDWVHDGNPGGLICGAAHHSKRGNEMADLARANDPDPIFAAIRAHEQAVAAYDVFTREGDEEQEETAAYKSRIDELADAEADAECDLINVAPTTIPGVIALLEHAAKIEKGIGFRECYLDPDHPDQKRGHSWYYFVNRNLADTLRSIAA